MHVADLARVGGDDANGARGSPRLKETFHHADHLGAETRQAVPHEHQRGKKVNKVL